MTNDNTETPTEPHETDIQPGDTVIDIETGPSNPSKATVVEVTGVTAEDYHINALQKTVAAVNRDYPALDPVILIEFDGGNTSYSYPASRLEVIETDESDTDETDKPQSLDEWTEFVAHETGGGER